MITVLLLIAMLVVLLIAGYRRISLKQWTLVLLGLMVAWTLYRMSCGCFGIFMWVGWGATAFVALFNIEAFRHSVFIKPIFKLYRKLLPKMSDTEREALEAGTVWWDAEVFAGRPDWNKLLDAPKPALSQREQAFIDGPVREVCAIANQFEINHVHKKLPDEIWQFLKENGFFGMIIGEEHGGLGFSVQAQSEVVSILSTRSIALAVTVMVPNSLGPGELLHRFGTKEQQDYYLPRLASGEDIPFPDRLHLAVLLATFQLELFTLIEAWTEFASDEIARWTSTNTPGSAARTDLITAILTRRESVLHHPQLNQPIS